MFFSDKITDYDIDKMSYLKRSVDSSLKDGYEVLSKNIVNFDTILAKSSVNGIISFQIEDRTVFETIMKLFGHFPHVHRVIQTKEYIVPFYCVTKYFKTKIHNLVVMNPYLEYSVTSSSVSYTLNNTNVKLKNDLLYRAELNSNKIPLVEPLNTFPSVNSDITYIEIVYFKYKGNIIEMQRIVNYNSNYDTNSTDNTTTTNNNNNTTNNNETSSSSSSILTLERTAFENTTFLMNYNLDEDEIKIDTFHEFILAILNQNTDFDYISTHFEKSIKHTDTLDLNWISMEYWNTLLKQIDCISEENTVSYGINKMDKVFENLSFGYVMSIENEFTIHFPGDYVYTFMKRNVHNKFNEIEYLRRVERINGVQIRYDLIWNNGNNEICSKLPNVKVVCVKRKTENGLISYKSSLEIDSKIMILPLKQPKFQYSTRPFKNKHTLVNWYVYTDEDTLEKYTFSISLCKIQKNDVETVNTNLEFEFTNNSTAKYILLKILKAIFIDNTNNIQNVAVRM